MLPLRQTFQQFSRSLGLLPSNLSLFSVPVRCAGHSHWQNVRHAKAANDKLKEQASSEIVSKLNNAIRESGGNRDPKTNSAIQRVIELARSKRVSHSLVERVLNGLTTTDPYLIGIRGRGGILILVETCNAKVNVERGLFQGVCKKFGLTLLPGTVDQSVLNLFSHKGYVTVALSQNKDHALLKDLDVATELAIEVGAEDVLQQEEEDSELVYQFVCSPTVLSQVKAALVEKGLTVSSTKDDYSPNETVPISQEAYDELAAMYSRLQNVSDYVQRVFDNTTVEKTN